VLLLLAVASAASAATRGDAPTLAGVRALLVRHAVGAARGVAAAPTPCGKPSGVLCTTVQVPLDRTGAIPGTISLHVEVLPAEGFQRGVMFLIAGGPGQGSARVFDLGNSDEAAFDRFLFPGYTLVAYDDRGTGASGLLDCPALQVATSADAEQAAAAACANTIGPARDFYSTADHAEDLEAVRQALGYDRVALYGVSYGTKLAMAYALAHPDHVERLILNSVLPPNENDPFGADVLKAMPATLTAFCSDGGCNAATHDFAGDVVAVANKLGSSPVTGKILEPGGGTKTMHVDGLDVLSVVVDADLNPGLAAELPAAVHAARLGQLQQLLRLVNLDESQTEKSVDLSFALYAATVCRDGPFPWAPDTPIPARAAIEQAAINSLGPTGFGPFGTWAARFGNADFCLDWPSPSGGATLGSGPLPNVPMLAVSGGFDMRTPTAGAASVVAQFPQGHLLVVPGIGHDTVDADISACAARAVRAWMTDVPIPQECPRPKALVTPVPALPAPGSAHGPRLAASQTYRIARKTLHEAEAAWLTTTATQTAGLFGGRLVITGAQKFKLVRYSIARGVTATGNLRLARFGPPLVFSGSLTIGGTRAAGGLLKLSGGSLHGKLGGHTVG
jgi:pimeloyl-ACP methyl ester carboxylesterase